MIYTVCSRGGEFFHQVYSVICYRLCYTPCVVTGVSLSPGLFCNLLEIMLHAVCSHVGYFHQAFCNFIQIMLYALCSQGGVSSHQIIIIYGVILCVNSRGALNSILFFSCFRN